MTQPMDDALERLGNALDAADGERWRAPESPEPLRRLEAAIAPLRLPDDVRRFWELVDPSSLGVSTYPTLSPLELVRQGWETDVAPRPPLLGLAYESHATVGVELTVGAQPGGALFDWLVSDPDYRRICNSLPAWIDAVADDVATGRYDRRHAVHRGTLLAVHGREVRDWRPAPHPVHGDALDVPADIVEWPEHWQRAAGLTPAHVTPLGRTHTIAELLAEQPTTATIVAQVVGVSSSGGSAAVRLDDESGELGVRCPADVCLLGPVLVATMIRRSTPIPAG